MVPSTCFGTLTAFDLLPHSSDSSWTSKTVTACLDLLQQSSYSSERWQSMGVRLLLKKEISCSLRVSNERPQSFRIDPN